MLALLNHKTDNPSDEQAGGNWGIWLIALPVLYVLSSGPVMGLCFWLRESTGWDGWYYVMLIYWPLRRIFRYEVMGSYIEWWVVDVFHTIGPG